MISSPRAACSSDSANQPLFLFLHRYSFHRLSPMAKPMPNRRILQRPDGAFIERHARGVYRPPIVSAYRPRSTVSRLLRSGFDSLSIFLRLWWLHSRSVIFQSPDATSIAGGVLHLPTTCVRCSTRVTFSFFCYTGHTPRLGCVSRFCGQLFLLS